MSFTYYEAQLLEVLRDCLRMSISVTRIIHPEKQKIVYSVNSLFNMLLLTSCLGACAPVCVVAVISCVIPVRYTYKAFHMML